ncbi:hypothetical protein BpHYR1_025530 [Brachionus plicatilis]|uniref:Uncharacterized protein n=1 Tax=Brachionus plicatilis TaxID=10195 RepID=A0A3M7SB37_BRAPC|nr:hypothetical protein BpHYR1_025530 [Brachionus plicatilis]
MTKINSSKEEALRIREYASTVYRILKRSEYFPPERKKGSGQTPKKMTKLQLNKLKKAFDHKDNISQRKAAKKFDISQKIVSKLLKKL